MSFGQIKKEETSQVIRTHPLCKLTDMTEDEMKQETMDLCVTATEKYPNNYEHAAKMIKENLDKKFGAPFQVVVGESFGFHIIHQENTLLYMFTGA
ncbi:hypothetical protein KQX54_019981 [Cotesia glomerata]|uniref:Dynein light chain n=1 Tax=Cotesia glomerata TaxID=32391 RepID=A0AAV7IXH9_COTGL|nr:hypothetical protein KQX54_019981 [Cotesia glomerata]